MANELFIQSRGFAKILQQTKGIDYSTCPVEVLADGYCEATDNGFEQDRNLFISGLILRFWYTVKKMQDKSPGLGYDQDEFAHWLYEAIEYACKYRKWQDPANKVNAQQCINQCIETIRLQHYYQLNLQKHKASFRGISLETPIGSAEDKTTLFDTFADETVEEEFENTKGAVSARAIVQAYVDKKKLVEAIILDTIAFSASVKENKVSTRLTERDDETGEATSAKGTAYSYEFWSFKAIQALKELPADYTEYFLANYDVKPAAIKAAIEAIRKANSQKLYKYLRACLSDAKRSLRPGGLN